jgi:heptaprenyl diphosphate synthase
MHDRDIQVEVDRLKDEIDKRMQHAFLKKNIELPVLDNEKLSMLCRMFRETSCSRQKINTYVVSVMLVQAALDAHESITVRRLTDNEMMKNRQLTILAGDYYSGLYYRLLSEIEEVRLTRKLAHSIQEINEHKMFLYKRESQTAEQTFESLRVIESSLLRNVAEYFELPLWGAFFEEYFLLRRLLAERHHFTESHTSPVVDALDPSERKKGSLLVSQQEKIQQMTHLLDSYIDRVRQTIERLFSNHSRFENLIGGRMWDIFLESRAFKQKLAEEG